MNVEQKRLAESDAREKHWKRWGPYLSERAWGTVREDYSASGSAWDYLPHDHARSRAYRWNEDGIAGICDRHQDICFALALWNGRDPILKERIFGLTGSEENHRRGKLASEFELIDTGIFNEDRYFDVIVEYAKADVEDILIKITAINRGPETASLNLLPTIWFRNTWSWNQNGTAKPNLGKVKDGVIELNVNGLGKRWLYCDDSPELLFTENDTNTQRLFNSTKGSHFVKDGINDFIIHGSHEAVNSEHVGTKAAANYKLTIAPGETATIRLRLSDKSPNSQDAFVDFDKTFAARIHEADEFYQTVIPKHLTHDARTVMRQSLGGLLWSKQFYHYVIEQWLDGDSDTPKPPAERKNGRNHQWKHLYNADVISMPDKWEYPWYAAWDLAFHCVPLALVDSEFAKEQLVLMLREWYMHPNGQLPAYEWAFGDG